MLWALYSMTVFLGRLITRVMVSLHMHTHHSYTTLYSRDSTDLMPTVMVWSFAVLFHSDIMSSLLLIDMTAPHISLPTMNCSPMIASN